MKCVKIFDSDSSVTVPYPVPAAPDVIPINHPLTFGKEEQDPVSIGKGASV